MILYRSDVKLFFLLFYFVSVSNASLTDWVATLGGYVKGQYRQTVVGRVQYAAFKGIPYAKSPIGQYRFKPPEKADVFGNLQATRDDHMCPQYDMDSKRVVGHEDCLYLNVYTPEVHFNHQIRRDRAVMVWIHGGAFLWGSKKQSQYGPDFLLEKDVIVVAMNYRLGAFGFLTAGKHISGNMGLKDQAFALKWVHDNIGAFGGDPTKVTIFGESAGAVSVELQRLSAKSQGLFRASIAMSGSPLNPWAFAKRSEAEDMTKELIKSWSKDWGMSGKEHLEFSAWDSFIDGFVDVLRDLDEDEPSIKEIYKKLAETSTEKIVTSTHQLMNSQMTIPFLPTIESKKINHAFITKSPRKIYKTHQCNAVPHILGFTNDEFIGIAPLFVRMFNKMTSLQTTTVLTASYMFFDKGIDKTREYLNEYYPNSNVWAYNNAFDYPQSLHRVAGLNKSGCGHADDLAHIFYMQGKNQPVDPQSDIGKHRERMVIMWTNFAKYLNPTPEVGSTRAWPPAIPSGSCLKIGQTLTLEPLPGSTEEEIEDGVYESLYENI